MWSRNGRRIQMEKENINLRLFDIERNTKQSRKINGQKGSLSHTHKERERERERDCIGALFGPCYHDNRDGKTFTGIWWCCLTQSESEKEKNKKICRLCVQASSMHFVFHIIFDCNHFIYMEGVTLFCLHKRTLASLKCG